MTFLQVKSPDMSPKMVVDPNELTIMQWVRVGEDPDPMRAALLELREEPFCRPAQS